MTFKNISVRSKRYIFIMGHPRSGSTLLKEILATSTETSVMPKEGLKLLGELTPPNFGFTIWDPVINLDMELIKNKWHNIWNSQKKYLIEKSPPLILRFNDIFKSFNNCIFLCLIRNPYAYVASVRKRFPDSSPYYIAKFWCVMAVYIMNGFKKYENHSILIRYEDLTDSTENVINEIVKKVPGLGILDVNKRFSINQRESKISNMNFEQISSLNEKDLVLITTALNVNRHILDFFSYSIPDGICFGIEDKFDTYFLEDLKGHHAKLLNSFNLNDLGVR